jgi:hypothetical protein
MALRQAGFKPWQLPAVHQGHMFVLHGAQELVQPVGPLRQGILCEVDQKIAVGAQASAQVARLAMPKVLTGNAVHPVASRL